MNYLNRIANKFGYELVKFRLIEKMELRYVFLDGGMGGIIQKYRWVYKFRKKEE